MSARTTTGGRWLPFVLAVAVLTSAGFVWLWQSSTLAATGRHIATLETRRQTLLEQRAGALVAYAAATDPARLEAAARSLGYGPAEHVHYLSTDLPTWPHDVAQLTPGSPLALRLDTAIARPAQMPEGGLLDRLAAWLAETPEAEEAREASAIGGAGAESP